MERQVLGKAVVPFLSPGIRIGNLIFISGQLPVAANGELINTGIEEQTRQVLENIKTVVEQGGGTMDSIVKTTVFLSDIADFKAMNEVYTTFFRKFPPARSTFEVKLAVDAKVEIEAIAVLS